MVPYIVADEVDAVRLAEIANELARWSSEAISQSWFVVVVIACDAGFGCVNAVTIEARMCWRPLVSEDA